VVAADDAGGAYPFGLTGGARLLVDETDAENAAAVLSEQNAGEGLGNLSFRWPPQVRSTG
jgi:hypothetical protein